MKNKLHNISPIFAAFTALTVIVLLILFLDKKHTIIRIGTKPPKAVNANSTGTMLAADSQRTGIYKTTGINQQPSVLWKFTVDKSKDNSQEDSITSSPVVSNGKAYFATIGGAIYAVDIKTGKKVWKYQENWTINYASPAYANGIVYIGTDGDGMNALDANTGELLWKFKPHIPYDKNDMYASDKFEVNDSPAIIDGILYVGTGNGLYALDAYTGTILWHADAGGSSPAVSRDVVFSNNGLGTVYAVEKQTGKIKWSKKIPSTTLFSYPVLQGNTLFITNDEGDINALAQDTGNQIWQNTATCSNPVCTSGARNNPAVSSNSIYNVWGDGYIGAFDVTTGTIQWQKKIGTLSFYPPIIDNNTIYITTHNYEASPNSNFVYAIDAETGKKQWEFYIPPHGETGNSPLNSPALYNGVLYVGTSKGQLYALH